jgi:hypothetical protein
MRIAIQSQSTSQVPFDRGLPYSERVEPDGSRAVDCIGAKTAAGYSRMTVKRPGP